MSIILPVCQIVFHTSFPELSLRWFKVSEWKLVAIFHMEMLQIKFTVDSWPTFSWVIALYSFSWLIYASCILSDTRMTVGSKLPCVETKRKRSDSVLWKKPLHQQKCQKNKVTTQTPQKKFDYTAIADRHRTVSWSNYSHPTGWVPPLVKYVFRIFLCCF